MAERKAKDGAPKAAPAEAATPPLTKTARKAAPVLPVKAEAPAKPPFAAVKKPARKVAPPLPLPVAAVEAVETPALPAIEIPAAPMAEAVVQESVTNIQDNVTKGIDQMATQTFETADAGKTAADQAQALFGDFNERAKTAMEKNAKIVQEVSDLAKGNVEALVASSRAAAKGIEALSREAAEYSRKSFEDVSGALKSFSEVRSPADLFRLQSDYARSYFDAVVAETSKLSEQVIKLAGEVAEPITNRASVAAERVRTIAF